jgi:hypothetical protein
MIQNLAKFIPPEGESVLLELVGRIERLRALQDDESRLVELLIRKERRRSAKRVQRQWSPSEKAELFKAGKKRGGVKAFAASHNMPELTAWHMLRHLRNGNTKRAKVKG